MERIIPISIKIEEKVTTLETLPVSIEQLVSHVEKRHPQINWEVYYNDYQIKSTKNLVITYLNNKSPQLLLEFKPASNPITVIDDEVKQQVQEMAHIYQQLNISPSEATQILSTQNGVLSKTDLLRVIKKITQQSTRKLLETNQFFINKRQQFYGVDEQKYRETVLEYINFHDMLIISTIDQTLNWFGLTKTVFEMSIQVHQTDDEVYQALEQMQLEYIQGTVNVSESLTREKLIEVLLFGYEFLKEQMQIHGNTNPMQNLILKFKEYDEITKKFGYHNYDIISAVNKYNTETDPYFEDLIQKFDGVQTDSFGFN